jgi:carbamoyl-phosphate synthase large subunit
MQNRKVRVMIAGIGGASLGTELAKSLRVAGHYKVYGCDISKIAYGHYCDLFDETFVVDKENYLDEVIDKCRKHEIDCLVPGGEQPLAILTANSDRLTKNNMRLAGNTESVIKTCSNKRVTFSTLKDLGFLIPRTVEVAGREDFSSVCLPCVIKPSTGTGGSAMVFFAQTIEDAIVYAQFIRMSGSSPIAQEYIDHAEGEFTVGVLSLPSGEIAGSIALRRSFDAKLSLSYKTENFLISSGYSQGFIGNFPGVCSQAEAIAKALDSRGPLNIQGRLKNDEFIPFEINPRFSASTYLRAMAGFNEVDIFIQALLFGKSTSPPEIKSGWYLRSLSEEFVAPERVGRE